MQIRQTLVVLAALVLAAGLPTEANTAVRSVAEAAEGVPPFSAANAVEDFPKVSDDAGDDDDDTEDPIEFDDEDRRLRADASSTHATFGTITSGSKKCVVGNPNAYISTKDVNWVWTKRMSTYVPQFKNFIFDQLHASNGTLNYCVRWDSTNKLTKAVASKFEAMLNRQYKAWNYWLKGYDCWPYNDITVKVVGFAVRKKSLLDWSDSSLGTIYVGNLDADGVPQCPTECYRHEGQVPKANTSKCKAKPFDMSLWPTLNMGGGAGGDWGQRVDAANMLASIDNDQLQIVAHEIGHGFGLPDFYEESDKPASDFPACIMEAGASMTITPGDGWMLRRVYEHIRSRYA